MATVKRLAWKDLAVNETVIHMGWNEIVTAVKHYPNMTVIDTEKLTPEKMKNLLKMKPDTTIIEE